MINQSLSGSFLGKYKYSRKSSTLSKILVSSFITAAFVTGGFLINNATAQAMESDAALGVTGITTVANSSGSVGYATADGSYDNGWRWVFNVTVPNNQTLLKMKFADWVNGSNIIPAGGNIQILGWVVVTTSPIRYDL